MVFLSLTGLARGQVNPGAQSFSAYDSHTFDAVNLQNLNIMLTTPIYGKSGAFPLQYIANQNSYCHVGSGSKWVCTTVAPLTTPGVPSASVGNFLGISNGAHVGFTQTVATSCPLNPTQLTIQYTGPYIIDATGAKHPLPTTDTVDSYGCINSTLFDWATDGSGLALSIPNSTVSTGYIYTSSGMQFTTTYLDSGGWPPTRMTDANGNSITVSDTTFSFTDTLGIDTLDLNSGWTSASWKDENASSTDDQSVSNITSTLNIATNFGCSGKVDQSSTSVPTFTGYQFPVGSLSWTLNPTYNKSGYYDGRIGTITLPAGGTITYTYSGGNNGINCTYQVPPTVKRTTSDGTTEYDWVLVNNGNGNYGNTTTVIDNGGNKTVYTFTGLTSTGNAAYPIVQALTEVQHYQGSSTLLTTDVYCYNAASGQPGNCSTAVVSLPITEVDVYHTINGMSNSSRTQTRFDKYGNALVLAHYGFGASSPTFQTTTTYGSWNGSACVSISGTIQNKPCDVLTVSGSNNIAESRFKYDAHGNLLTTYEWTGTAWLSSSTANVYNSNGTIQTSYDLANNPTSYAYNGTGGCNNLFPTSVTAGSLTSYKTWNCNGGVIATISLPNNSSAVTTYDYKNSSGTADPYWRVSSITDPLGNVSYTNYTVTSQQNTFTFNSSSSISNTTRTTDGYGRTTNVQHQQSPSGTDYDTLSTSYGWSTNYRTVATSQACSASLGGNCATVRTNYVDPLGRLYQESTQSNETLQHTYTQNDDLAVLSPAPAGESNKQVQNEYDGLGRLTSSCAISSTVNGNVSCNQNTNNTAKGVLTTASYASAPGTQTISSTRGSQTRSTTVDALGRTIQKVTPEGGTWSLKYDSNSSCPSGYRGSTGQLASMSDPNGNLICYAYDTLNRLTGVNANGTSCRHFYYDNSTGYSGVIPNGVSAPTNSNGRMVEAATDTCSAGTLTTDEWFSYDKDGHATDLWQSSPHSTQYYHSVATYAGNGAVTSLQLASPSLYTMTYGLDGEGRRNTLKQGSTNIVTGPLTGMYDAAGRVLNVQLTGSTPDQDIYTYDLNTGSMKTFEFEVGSSNLTGTPTWNANGTLSQLQIVDGFNSGGSQVCAFSYDDLSRLLTDACGAENYIMNAGFESGDTGWVHNSPYTMVNNPSNAQSGSWYLSGTSTSQAGADATTNGTTTLMTVVPGSLVQYGGWVNRVSGTGYAWWGCEFRDGSGNHIVWCSAVGIGDRTTPPGWNYYDGSITAPSNAAYVLFYAEIHGAGDPDTSSTTAYFDSALFSASASLWNQTFTYDQYDNLSKNGNPGTTWNPGYSSTTNRVTGASYDSNGNMTNDGVSNVYGWNEFSKMKWTAPSGTPTCGSSGKCTTYDAFGRMVETSIASTWTELWYTQVPGSRVSMNGATEKYAYWPSPGRGVFVDTGSKTFVHQDWLGNDRIASLTASHTVAADRAYAPYGEQYNAFGGTNPIYGMFAGITGDYDSGVLFDTPNRELASSQGRWVSPDPAGAGWNQYAYATNPNSQIDPSGLFTSKLPFNGSSGGTPQYGGYDPGALMEFTLSLEFGSVPANSGSSNPGSSQSGNPTAPQLCFCPNDMTSGAMAGTVSPLPDALNPGAPYFSPGTPAAVQLVGFLFEYEGSNGLPDPTTGQVTPLISGVPIDAQLHLLVFQEQLVDVAGLPVMPAGATNPYQISENLVNTALSNQSATAGSWPSQSGSWVDNVGFWNPPTQPLGVVYMQNMQTYTVNGSPVSGSFMQLSSYVPGAGLVGNVISMGP